MTRCTAKSKTTGEQCRQQAINGSTKCYYHGGRSLRGTEHPNFKTGRYIRFTTESIRAKIDESASSDPMDLLDELAVQRALFAEYLQRFQTGAPLTALDIGALMNWADGIGHMVERIVKIRNSTALTGAEIQYLQTRIVDVLTRYIPDPKQQEQFISELFGAPAVRGEPARIPAGTDRD